MLCCNTRLALRTARGGREAMRAPRSTAAPTRLGERWRRSRPPLLGGTGAGEAPPRADPPPRAGEHTRPYVVVSTQLLSHGQDLVPQDGIQGVQLVRPVKGHDGHTVPPLQIQVLVPHWRGP